MREIKFRAWDIKREKMCEVADIGWGNHGEIEIRCSCYSDYSNISCFVLEQYTGLKDKNGVEIYEGDILTPSSYKKATGPVWGKFKSMVVFDNGMFKLNGPIISDLTPLSKSLEFGRKAGNEYEVIGNIHEKESQ